MHRLTGIGVSPGVAVGRAVLLAQNPLVLRFPIGDAQVEAEVTRLREARDRSRRQLQDIKARIARRAGAELGYLFEAQLLMLEDPMLLDRAVALVREQRVNAEWAVQRAYEDLLGIFDSVDDAYLRERKGDVADIVGRLRMNLGRARAGSDLFRDVDAPSVLIADELTPSMAAQVNWRKILGFASDIGSRTHHTAILARSLGVPAVVGLGQASTRIAPGATVIIDGTNGELIVDPEAEALAEAGRRGPVAVPPERRRAKRLPPARTSDSTRIALQANIELPGDVPVARSQGAEGIGLFRSEFLIATVPPGGLTEDTQYQVYRGLVEGMAPGSVTVRTFDVDEDQLAPWNGNGGNGPLAPRPNGTRGALGLRAIQFNAGRREIFKTQLRALLRAARHGRLRIIFPFVSGVEELREARAVVAEAARELAERGEAPRSLPPIGVMIEVPSAAVTADLLAREADFFSIGTNDLIQYSLAVDRTDSRVSRLYEPVHPAVLRTIRSIVRAAERRELPVSLCGEMASDPALLPVLVGLGLRDFSMNPAAIPMARRVILRLSAADATRLAARVMKLATVNEIEQYLSRVLGTPPAGVGIAGQTPDKGGASDE